MAEERLTITYSGPALASGRMDVRDLAPALIGLADAIGATNRVVNPGTLAPGVAVSATNEGSFEVVLHVVEAGLLDRMADLLTGREINAAINLRDLVGICIGGFILVKSLRNRKIKKTTQPEQGRIRVTLSDGYQLDLPEQSMTIARNVDFRRAAKKTVDPVEADRVESVEIRSAESEVRVEPPEVPAFDVPEVEEEELPTTTTERYLRLVNVAFAQGKWKVTEGDEPYWVAIADQEFLHRVETNQAAFTAGDVLHVEMRSRQWHTATGIRTEHTVNRVIDHIPGPRQIPLPIEEPDA